MKFDLKALKVQWLNYPCFWQVSSHWSLWVLCCSYCKFSVIIIISLSVSNTSIIIRRYDSSFISWQSTNQNSRRNYQCCFTQYLFNMSRIPCSCSTSTMINPFFKSYRDIESTCSVSCLTWWNQWLSDEVEYHIKNYADEKRVLSAKWKTPSEICITIRYSSYQTKAKSNMLFSILK